MKKSKKPLWQRIFSWFFSILVVLIAGFALTYQIVGSVTRSSNYGVANFFGYQTLVIATDSMDPVYPVGDAVIVKKVDPSTIKVGDDLTFYYNDMIYTHRLGSVTSTDGVYTFTCHGINTQSDQCGGGDCTYQTQTFTDKYLLGKVIGSSKFIGGFYNFLIQPYGLIVLILIPGSYLIISSILDIVKARKADKVTESGEKGESIVLKGEGDEEDKEIVLTEEDKKRLKKEYLEELTAEMEKEKEKNKKDDDNSKGGDK